MILLLIFSLFSQADSKQLISKCTNRHQTLAKQCSNRQDVSAAPGISATGAMAMAYVYDNCKDSGIHSLFLDHLSATAVAPSMLTCSISTSGIGGTQQEVHTSLNTSLLVQTDGSEVETAVQTKDGILKCKSTATGSNGESEVWWCGVMLKKSSSFVELHPVLAFSDLTPALYGKKTLNSYINDSLSNSELSEIQK